MSKALHKCVLAVGLTVAAGGFASPSRAALVEDAMRLARSVNCANPSAYRICLQRLKDSSTHMRFRILTNQPQTTHFNVISNGLQYEVSIAANSFAVRATQPGKRVTVSVQACQRAAIFPGRSYCSGWVSLTLVK